MEDLTIIAKVAARFASATLTKGDILEVWMKRGDWWSEMRRGVKLEVKDVQGDTIRVQHRGWSEGKGWEMKIPSGQDLSGKFKLEGDAKFKRSLVVTKLTTSDDDAYVPFGPVARSKLNDQAQYARHWLQDPEVGAGIRWNGDFSNYHSLKIHKDDILELERRVLNKNRELGRVR